MKNKWMNMGMILAVLSLTLAVGFSQLRDSQPPQGEVQPQEDVSIQELMGTAFTYQGVLKKGSNPVNDTCDFEFSLYDNASGGAQIGMTQTKLGVQVSNGYFTIPDLDFGFEAFQGNARWLEIAVKCAGDTNYSVLSPRQRITAAPYALFSKAADTLDGHHASEFATAGLMGSSFAQENASPQASLFSMSATGWSVLTDGDPDVDHTLVLKTTNWIGEYTLWYENTWEHGEFNQYAGPVTIQFPHYRGFQLIIARYQYIAWLVCNENDNVVACLYQQSHP
jgi:hypothetical protein